ncbi:KTSC domain-containing protein [Wenyingzhuangia sp. 2_MG-2023]|uniref:KTSC domain-containing protein n=1 Tax=Wenyingzhuangia sp. 2_MG-2023 TaxID=3062639 RepID=UPI0026E16D51|nr:KTSC domain-containing protein [Wenyingzhuangia sp. 2_MG-2023]MDO6738540.1 KTSC domain-containing protein [Wenyingzhuangia sp. 2_MG-2023]
MSSIIASVGYNTSEEILEIEFKRNRDIWQYSEVPNLLWTEFVKSNSKGKFFLKEIKDKYPRVKI